MQQFSFCAVRRVFAHMKLHMSTTQPDLQQMVATIRRFVADPLLPLLWCTNHCLCCWLCLHRLFERLKYVAVCKYIHIFIIWFLFRIFTKVNCLPGRARKYRILSYEQPLFPGLFAYVCRLSALIEDVHWGKNNDSFSDQYPLFRAQDYESKRRMHSARLRRAYYIVSVLSWFSLKPNAQSFSFHTSFAQHKEVCVCM